MLYLNFFINFIPDSECLCLFFSQIVDKITSNIYILIKLSNVSLYSPVCFDIIDEAHMTKCGHTFW